MYLNYDSGIASSVDGMLSAEINNITNTTESLQGKIKFLDNKTNDALYQIRELRDGKKEKKKRKISVRL